MYTLHVYDLTGEVGGMALELNEIKTGILSQIQSFPAVSPQDKIYIERNVKLQPIQMFQLIFPASFCNHQVQVKLRFNKGMID